jgi:hypothetical protein
MIIEGNVHGIKSELTETVDTKIDERIEQSQQVQQRDFNKRLPGKPLEVDDLMRVLYRAARQGWLQGSQKASLEICKVIGGDLQNLGTYQ